MNITQALALAQKHINVSYCGGYYVSMPFYGLSDAGGPTNAACNTMPYCQALSLCRARRISEVVEAVTGDKEYADSCFYEQEFDRDRSWCDDWRSQARHFVREYNQGDKA